MGIGNVLYGMLPLREKDVVDNLLSNAKDKPLSAYQGSVLEGKIGQLINKNLLDNTNFKHPVNMRGQSSYSTTSGMFFIDKWWLFSTNSITSELIENGLKLTWKGTNDGIQQRVDKAMLTVGEKYTLSVSINNVVYSATFTYKDNSNIVSAYSANASYSYCINSNINDDFIRVYAFTNYSGAGSCTINWVKLEKGERFTGYQPINYLEELAKCQLWNEGYGKGIPIRLTQHKNIYVDGTNGNDSTGNGTQAKPWKSIQRAVDFCPNLNNLYTYTIYIASGTYNENVFVDRKTLYLKGINNPDIVINGSISVQHYGRLEITEINSITINMLNTNRHGLLAFNMSYLYSNVPFTINGYDVQISDSPLHANASSYIYLESKVRVSKGLFGCISIGNSTLYVKQLYSGDSTNGICSDTGSSITLGDATLEGTLKHGILSNTTGKVFMSQLYNNATITENLLAGTGEINLESSQNWKFIGSATGTGSVDITDAVKKFVNFKVVQTYGSISITHELIRGELSATLKLKIGGWYRASNACGDFILGYTNTSFSNHTVNFNGQDVMADATITVYAKR